MLEDAKADLMVKHGIDLLVDTVPLSSVAQSFCYERSKDLTLLKLTTAKLD
jgi:hypothetical protein